MGNTLLTPSIIAREALMVLEANLVLANLVHRDYSKEFAKVGDTVTIRKPATFESKVWNGSTIDVQDATETSTSVTLDTVLDVSFAVTAKEMTLNIQDFSEQLIAPAMRAHAQKVDSLLAGRYVDVPSYVLDGTSAAISDFSGVIEKLNDAKCPLDQRSMVFGAKTHAKYVTVDGLVEADKSGSPQALRNAIMGRILGMDTYMDQNVVSHVPGTVASFKSAGTAGESTLTLTSVVATTATFKVGDVITANGHQHVVTEAMTAVSGGGTLKVYPAVPETHTATDGVIVSKQIQNLAFHKNAFALVSRPLAAPLGAKSEYISYKGIGCRVVYDYNMQTKTDTVSIDMLLGTKTLTPELAVRFLGAA